MAHHCDSSESELKIAWANFSLPFFFAKAAQIWWLFQVEIWNNKAYPRIYIAKKELKPKQVNCQLNAL